MAGLDLAADLERSLAEEVEKVEMERRREGLAHAAGGLRSGLVPQRGRRAELLLDRLDVTVELHCDITMTSLSMSVKGTRTSNVRKERHNSLSTRMVMRTTVLYSARHC